MPGSGRLKRRAGAAAVTALAGLSACIPFPGRLPPASFPVAAALDAQTVVAPAERPSAAAFARDGRVFYTEKDTGRIRVISDGRLLDAPFAAVPVNHAGDCGLLSIALHPDFETNGRVYVFYTRSDTGAVTDDPRAQLDHRVVYFEAAGDVAAAGEIFVASVPPGTGTERIGGRIGFASDGTLLVGLGDMTDPPAAQNPELQNGKLLRFADDGTIPTDNPVAGSPLFASGFRDVRGLACEPDGAGVWVTDLNADGSHEVNRAAPATNHGWPSVVGLADGDAERAFADATPDYRDPLVDSGRERVGFVGGAFNPSTRYGPNVRGQFFYGEALSGKVVRLRPNEERTAAAERATFAEGFPSPIVDVAFTPAGTLYVVCADAIFRVAPVR